MILVGDHREIKKLIDRLMLETKSLIRSGLEISYYSRGSWQYETVMLMSAFERDMALEFVKERLKEMSKNPFAQI